MDTDEWGGNAKIVVAFNAESIYDFTLNLIHMPENDIHAM